MAHLVGTDRTQAVLLPDVLDDYVTADNPVRFLDAFVAQLDRSGLGFQRCRRRPAGRAMTRATCSGSPSRATSTGSGPAGGWSRRPIGTSS